MTPTSPGFYLGEKEENLTVLMYDLFPDTHTVSFIDMNPREQSRGTTFRVVVPFPGGCRSLTLSMTPLTLDLHHESFVRVGPSNKYSPVRSYPLEDVSETFFGVDTRCSFNFNLTYSFSFCIHQKYRGKWKEKGTVYFFSFYYTFDSLLFSFHFLLSSLTKRKDHDYIDCCLVQRVYFIP